MSIITPAQFMAQNETMVMSPVQVAEKAVRIRLQMDRHGRIPDSFVVPATCEYIEKLTSIQVTPNQLQEMLALYPAEKARLSRFTAGDFAHCELVKTGVAVTESYLIANVVAHFFGQTLWPKASDAIDIKAFITKIQRSAMILGYSVAGCTSQKLTA
jgi:hypothetical protein